MNKVINISSNGIKQAIDDLVNENELLQDKIYKQNEEIERLNNIIEEVREYVEQGMNFDSLGVARTKRKLLEMLNKGNDEIEIIEEDKKIEKLDIRNEKNCKNNWKWKVYGEEHSYNISTPQKIIADKINEIIDYINKGV